MIISKLQKWILFSIFSTALLYTLLGFVLIPYILSNQLPPTIESQLNRKTSISKIEFNPYSFELNLTGFELKNINESRFIAFKQLYLNFQLWNSLTSQGLVFEKISLNQADINISRDKQADFNFSDLLNLAAKDSDSSSDETTSLPPILIKQFDLLATSLHWNDQLHKQILTESIYPIDLSIRNLSTFSTDHFELEADLKLASGGSFEWQGKVNLNPLQSTGNIGISHIRLNKVWQLFLQHSHNFAIKQGTETFSANYIMTKTDDNWQLKLADASLSLLDFQLTDKTQSSPNTLISIPELSISGLNFNLLEKKIEIADMTVDKGNLFLSKDEAGQINLTNAFTPVEKSHEKNETVSEVKPKENDSDWSVVVNNFSLNRFSSHYLDQEPQPDYNLLIENLNLNASDIQNIPEHSIPFQLSFDIKDGGSIHSKGQATIKPFISNFKLKTEAIVLNQIQTYLKPLLNIEIKSGTLDSELEINITETDQKEFAVSASGNTVIKDFISKQIPGNDDLFNFKQLSIQGLDINTSNSTYHINQVALIKPYAHIALKKNKQLNLNQLNKSKPQPELNQKKSKIRSSIKVSNFTIEQGTSKFTDNTLVLPFSTTISNLYTRIGPLDLTNNPDIKIDLKGKFPSSAPISIQGQFNPASIDSDFSLHIENMALPSASAYMAQLSSRKIEKGNLSLELQLKISDYKLDSTSKLYINKLELGDSVENPDAVDLPIEFAIALLEDADGKIDLNIPVQGQIDDPKFSITSLIFDAFVNVLNKIITSPFYAISSLVEGNDDLSLIYFSPGSANLESTQTAKLDSLVNALTKRPALNLEIKGAAYTSLDWPLLQTQSFEQLLADRAKKIDDSTEISDRVKKEIIKALFFERFPGQASESVFGKVEFINQPDIEFYGLAKQKLVSSIEVDQTLLIELANKRAHNISNYLLAKKIGLERIYVLDSLLNETSDSNQASTHLSLTSK